MTASIEVSIEVMDLVTCSFRAMGTDVHLFVVDGHERDLHRARAEVARLESLWSRFRLDSEVSAITRGAGHPVAVSAETLDLVRRARRAWETTGGAFDPLLGADLVALGYDRSFDDIDRSGAGGPWCPPVATDRGNHGIRLDPRARTVTIPPGTALDLGGIAKGWTADRLVAVLLDRGAAGACANIGGDLAVGGRAPAAQGWAIGVQHEAAATPDRVLWVREGGVATSTLLRRTWRGPDGSHRHHLLHPDTGNPVGGTLVEATVVAPTATDAEVLTKLAFVAPDRLTAALAAAGAAAILTTGDRASTEAGDPARLLGGDPEGEGAHAR